MNFKTILTSLMTSPTSAPQAQQPSTEYLNVPASQLPVYEEPKDFRSSLHWKVLRVISEFVDGWQFLADFKISATVFGSARFKEDHQWYEEARKLGKLLAENGYNVITGGGPGIMEAANRGAFECAQEGEAMGQSIGLNIQLPYEQRINPYVQKGIGFNYFFVRKVMLTYCAEVYAYFPGGFGTLDEFFEIVSLIQAKKVKTNIGVILVGKEFWQPLLTWLAQSVAQEFGFIDKNDLNTYTLVDTAAEAFAIVQKQIGDTTSVQHDFS